MRHSFACTIQSRRDKTRPYEEQAGIHRVSIIAPIQPWSCVDLYIDLYIDTYIFAVIFIYMKNLVDLCDGEILVNGPQFFPPACTDPPQNSPLSLSQWVLWSVQDNHDEGVIRRRISWI
jgi:hypothetical protein